MTSSFRHSRLNAWFSRGLQRFRARLATSPVATRLASGTFWSVVASSGSRAFALLAAIIVARLLGKAAFGELGIIQNTLDMFGTVAGFGMGLTATKYVAECRTTDPARTGRIIAASGIVAWVFGLAASVLLVMLGPWMAVHVLAAPQLATLLQISALSLLLSAVSGAQLGALAGFEAFKKLAIVSLFTGLMTFFCRVSGTLLWGLPGAVLGMVVAQALGCVLGNQILRSVVAAANVPVRLRQCLREFPMLWRFTLPSVLSALTVMPVNWLCSAMLVNEPNGYAEMGLFTAANQWYSIILLFPSLMSQAAMPVLSDRISVGAHQQSVRILVALVKASALILVPVGVISALSRPIMSFYGAEFATGWPTMVVSVVTAGVMAVQMPIAYMFAAKGRMWLWLAMTTGMGVCFIGLNFWLVHLGAIGMAWARLAAVSLHCGWAFVYVFRSLRHGNH